MTGDLVIEMKELGVAIGVLCPFSLLGVGLQAVIRETSLFSLGSAAARKNLVELARAFEANS